MCARVCVCVCVCGGGGVHLCMWLLVYLGFDYKIFLNCVPFWNISRPTNCIQMSSLVKITMCTKSDSKKA